MREGEKSWERIFLGGARPLQPVHRQRQNRPRRAPPSVRTAVPGVRVWGYCRLFPCVVDFLVWARKGRFSWMHRGKAREVGERKGMPEGKGKKGGRRAAGGKVDGRRILCARRGGQ